MKDWQGKRVLVIGAARQGTALAAFLARRGAQVVINDRRSPQELQEAREALAGLHVSWAWGGHPLDLLQDMALVCPSGGVPLELPLVVQARKRGIPLSNDSQVFLEEAPCPVIGITGSAGKTTTTTLVGRMAEQAMAEGVKHTNDEIRNVFVGGNIGNPLISFLDEMAVRDLAVMELSSFQLDIMKRSPQVAAVLNITPNHLDRHHSMRAYTAAKARILDFQHTDDLAVLNRDDPGAWGLASHVQGRLITFGRQPLRKAPPHPAWVRDATLREGALVLADRHSKQIIMPRADIQLRGDHNLMNVLASCAIAEAAGLPVEAMRSGVQGFQGVPHRLEFIRSLHGAAWFNDSIATAPERAMAAIRSFDEPLVLLAGGRDKDLPWENFVKLVCERVDHLVTFGETASMIAQNVIAARKERPYTVETFARLQPAVEAACQTAGQGDVVLLSPGGTSFDEFRDFAERGEWFKKWVMALE